MLEKYLDMLTPTDITYLAVLIVLFLLLIMTRRVRTKTTNQQIERLSERVCILENEMRRYITRSQQRLTALKMVGEGFEKMLQGVRGAVVEEEKALEESLSHLRSSAVQERPHDEDTEVIHIDRMPSEEDQ